MPSIEEIIVFGLVYSSPASALAAIVWARRSRVFRRVLPGHCANCSYDLAGLAAEKPCPECGVLGVRQAERSGVGARRALPWCLWMFFVTGALPTSVASIMEVVRDRWFSELLWWFFLPSAGLAIVFALVFRGIDARRAIAIGVWAAVPTLLYMLGHIAWYMFDVPTGLLWGLAYAIVVFFALGVVGHALLLGVAIEWWCGRRASREVR